MQSSSLPAFDDPCRYLRLPYEDPSYEAYYEQAIFEVQSTSIGGGTDKYLEDGVLHLLRHSDDRFVQRPLTFSTREILGCFSYHDAVRLFELLRSTVQDEESKRTALMDAFERRQDLLRLFETELKTRQYANSVPVPLALDLQKLSLSGSLRHRKTGWGYLLGPIALQQRLYFVAVEQLSYKHEVRFNGTTYRLSREFKLRSCRAPKEFREIEWSRIITPCRIVENFSMERGLVCVALRREFRHMLGFKHNSCIDLSEMVSHCLYRLRSEKAPQ